MSYEFRWLLMVSEGLLMDSELQPMAFDGWLRFQNCRLRLSTATYGFRKTAYEFRIATNVFRWLVTALELIPNSLELTPDSSEPLPNTFDGNPMLPNHFLTL